MNTKILSGNTGPSEQRTKAYTIARFAINGASGKRWLPAVTDTLPLAEAVRSG